MLLELGGGTKPHPRADVVIDSRHPIGSPKQDAAVTPWRVGAVPGAIGYYPEDNPTGNLWFTLDKETVDEVYASHFLEHIPKGQAIIDVMNEAWRILKPGGSFTIIVPLIGFSHDYDGGRVDVHCGWQAHADPTHVQGWWFPESLQYFTGQIGADADYQIRLWSPLGERIDELSSTGFVDFHKTGPITAPSYLRSWWSVRGGWEGVARLVKP